MKKITVIFAIIVTCYVPSAAAFNLFDVLIPASKAEKVLIYGSVPLESIAKAIFSSSSSDDEEAKRDAARELRRQRERDEMARVFDELANRYPEDEREVAKIQMRERFSDLVFDHPSVSERLAIIRAETSSN